MKNFKRDNPYFSLCGLNCGLCSMHLSDYCPGCGCGPHHSCGIAKCSLKHDKVEYCFQCDEFPCDKYVGADAYDSFITHRHQFKDIARAQKIGLETYTKEQVEKVEILHFLLANYNAGRQKTFFCLAVNLLELKDIQNIMMQISSAAEIEKMSVKEKSACVVKQFQELADKYGIELKIRKKPKAGKSP